MEIAKYIGSKIKYYRNVNNITQQEIGEYLGVRSQTVSRYESGILETNQDVLFKLAEFFKISINDFFPPLSFEKKDSKNDNSFNEIELLLNKYKDILLESDKNLIKAIIIERKKSIDK